MQINANYSNLHALSFFLPSLCQGLYDNFLSMKLKDPGLLGVCAGLDWLCFSDLVNEWVMRGQNYTLMRYLPFLPAAFHYLFAANSVPRISYPNSHYEVRLKYPSSEHQFHSYCCKLANKGQKHSVYWEIEQLLSKYLHLDIAINF